MPNKTHLTRQEEAIKEVGVQLRTVDPVSPTEEQVWLNVNENKLKSFVDGQVRVYFENYTTTSIEIPSSGLMDANVSYNYYKEILDSETFTIDNILDGVDVKIMLTNNQNDSVKKVDVALPSAAQMNNGNYWIIKSAANSETYHVWYDFDGTGLAEPVVVDSQPIRVIVTQGRKEKTDLLFKNISTTGSSYFTLSDHTGGSYYVWYNINGLNVNPLGSTPGGIQVNLTTGMTAAQAALATQTAINFVGVNVTTTIVGQTLTIEANSFGSSNDIQSFGTDVIQSVTRLVDGAPTTSQDQVASLTANALNLTSNFSATTLTNTVHITYLQPGKCDDIVNVDVPVGVSFLNIEQGSGPIAISFTNSISFANYAEAIVVPSNSVRLYEIVIIGPTIVGIYSDFDIA
jgi:hypothetical protein